MKIYYVFLSILIALTSISFAIMPLPVFASVTDGTVAGYAWSPQIGWINFGTTNGNIHITDTGLTGYAWNENFGRVYLNPTHGGVSNNNGSLSGSAWLEGIGWFDFSGVSVDGSGIFSGTATGDNNTSIRFTCANYCRVRTDWRPLGSRGGSSSPPPSSGAGGGTAAPAPSGTLSINANSAYANSASVALAFQSNDNIARMAVSNSQDFTNVGQEAYVTSKLWTLTPGDGLKTVYVRFYNAAGQASQIISASITLDTAAPSLSITNRQEGVGANQDVIISGITEPGATVNVFIDDNYSAATANGDGFFTINLGKLPIGSHHVVLSPKDLAQNAGSDTVYDINVTASPIALAPALPPLLHQLAEGLKGLIPGIFAPINNAPPAVAVIVPKKAPLAFGGMLYYLSTAELSTFVLAPLPADIALLTQVPQVKNTLKQVGIGRASNLAKLQNVTLTLPGLTEATTPKGDIVAGSFAPPKGIPFDGLSATAKANIPKLLVFAKGGGGLVDFNVALSLNSQGDTMQKIETVSGHSLQLIVRPDKPVKQVIGYIIFKSKKYQQAAFQIPLGSMAASLSFANPDLANAVAVNTPISVEGANVSVGAKEAAPAAAGAAVEQRLVVSTFAYIDNGNNVFTADVQPPSVDGEYEIITVLQYLDATIASKEIKLTTVVDPEGYIYAQTGDLQARIPGAVVSLYWLNPDTKQYELWSAKDFQQQNPQVTDARGTYSFLVPSGFYYINVDAPGYSAYDGKPFEVKEGSGVHTNIELKTKYWFLQILDWRTLLVIIMILLLGYNFYKDKAREKRI